ncbi:MAG: M24 family metallopeptidase, partial [Proteobacteria bacterium]|nr:M24 family metallopeptidase [Pseudomonadota bacterium]
PALAVGGNAPGPTTGQGLWPVRPQGAGWRRIGRHEPICVDIVSILGGYQVDQARIYSLGRPPDEVYRAQEAVLAVQDLIVDRARPGVVAGDLFDAAVDLVRAAGFERSFMGLGNGVPFVAHGVGLELDEWPVIGRGSNHVLQAGMTFALEPKIALPGVGMGGVENTFAVTEDGLERLTNYPDRIEVREP